MRTCTVGRAIKAPPAEAWDLLASTRAWTTWGPSVTAVDPPDVAVRTGLAGRVRIPGGLWVPFRVTDVRPGRSWSWSVLGIPATTHVVEAHPGGCRVTIGVPSVALPYLVVCRLALGRMAALLEASAVSTEV